MKTVYDTIVKNIKRYPSIFRNRTDVLEHLFCVVGNGFEWQNGCLDDGEYNSPPQEKQTLEDYLKEREEYYSEFLTQDDLKITLAKLKILKLKDDEDYKFRVENAEDLAILCWRKHIVFKGVEPDTLFSPRSIYPLCEYSAMFTVPDNVQPDWLAAAREMIQVVLNSKSYNVGDDEIEDNIGFAEKCLQSLNERFGT